MISNKILNTLEKSIEIHMNLARDEETHIRLNLAAQSAAQCIRNGGKIFFAGNGGSFADAQHLAAEFIGRMGRNRKSLPAVALGTNLSSLTAIGNDYSFEDVFKRELDSIGQKVDFAVILSTSGNSRNLIKLAHSLIQKKITTFSLLGCDGGELAQLCKHIIIPSSRTERIQECQILLGHIFCELVEDYLIQSGDLILI